jgi:putative membrane protein
MDSEKPKNKKLIKIILCVTIFAVLLVPMIYCAIYLTSIWDVYGKLDKVPVAFVNLDKSVAKGGKEYAIGKELEKSLKDNKKVGWKFVSHEEAMRGLEGKGYFAVIEIPEDFSGKVAGAQDGSFKSPEILYVANKGKNFVISQVTSRVADSIKAEVNSSIQKEISKALVDSLYDIKASIKDADDGTDTLQSGTQKLADGGKELANGIESAASGSRRLESGLRSAADSISKLQDGTQKLLDGSTKLGNGSQSAYNGSVQLHSGLKTAADSLGKLQTGMQALFDGSKELAAGAQQAADGSVQLNSGLKEAADSTAKLQAGTQKLFDGSTDLSNGLSSAADGSKQLIDGLRKITDGQIKIMAGDSSLGDGLNTFKISLTGSNSQITSLVEGASKVDVNAEQIAKAAEQLNLSTNLTALANGVKQSTDGLSKVAGILQSIDNSKLTDEDKAKLAEAIEQINGTNGIKTSMSNIEASLGTTAFAAEPLVTGLKKLQKEGTKKISEGTQKLAAELVKTQNNASAGIDQLIGGLKEIQSGNSGIFKGLSTATDKSGELASGLDKLSSGATSLKDGLKTVNDGNIALKDGLNTAVTKTGELSEGLKTLSSGATSLRNGLETVNSGNIALKDGLNAAATKTGELSNGLKTLNSGTISLRDSLKTVNDGNISLKDGLNTAAAKTGELSNGLMKLGSGAVLLKSGLYDVDKGVIKLKDGLKSGYNKLSDNLKFNSEDMSKFISEPVNVKDESINVIKHYGEGLAPYFISLSIWIGIMLMNLMLTLGKSLKVFNSKFMNSFSGKFLVGMCLAVIEALILSFVLVKWIGINPVNITWFYMTNIFIAIVFFGIMYGVSHGLGVLGAPIMFLVLILQLASSGGTFPMETAPRFFGAIGEILPMTYTVNALRMIISGVNSALLGDDIRALLIIMVLCLCGGLLLKPIINLGKKIYNRALMHNLASDC